MPSKSPSTSAPPYPASDKDAVIEDTVVEERSEPSCTSDDSDHGNEKATTERALADGVAMPMERKQFAIMIVALSMAVFLLALDETIIATAIPKITDQFDSLNDVCWYGSAYLLTMCCFQLHYGKFYKSFSSKWVLLTAIAIFEIGSLICATSPNSAALIFGRALAGSGACGIMSGTLIIVAKTVPLAKRSVYTSIIGSIRGVAGVAGPLLGGVITDSYLTWRWCFYINLPLGGAVAAVLIFLYHPPTEVRPKVTSWERIKKLDPLGLLFFVGSMVSLILGLQISGASSWSDPRVIALFTLFGVFFLCFAGVETWLGEEATLPPRIAKNRTVMMASFFVMCIDGAYYAVAYFLPIWFQAVLGTSASGSGIRSIPQIIGAILFSMLAGFIVMKSRQYIPVVMASTILTTVSMGLLYTLEPDSKAGEWIGYQLLLGIGVGLGMQQAAVIAQSVLKQADIPLGVSAVTFFQASGPTIMVSVSQNVFDQKLAELLKDVIPGLTSGELFRTGATKLLRLSSNSERPAILIAVNSALKQVWLANLIVSALSLIGVLGMRWRKLS